MVLHCILDVKLTQGRFAVVGASPPAFRGSAAMNPNENAELNGAQIEFMSPSKNAVRAGMDYESLFANDCIAQNLDSAHNEDSGFLQYVHLSKASIPVGNEAMSLYATSRTLETAFHHRHQAPFSGVASCIGGASMVPIYLVPVNPKIVAGGAQHFTNGAAVGVSATGATQSPPSGDRIESSTSVNPPQNVETADWIRRLYLFLDFSYLEHALRSTCQECACLH